MKVYIFGNGNIRYLDFERFYLNPLRKIIQNSDVEFIICDFRGVDTLAMEFLKTESHNVTILHIGEKPRYLPDKYRTKVSQWNIIGGFEDDISRDSYAIETCTHFMATDFNSNEKRQSGTQKNILFCQAKGRIKIVD